MEEADPPTAPFGMSPDARYFAFASYSTNLDSSQINTNIGIFVRDLTLGVTTVIAISGVDRASISGDGRYVAYNNLIYDRTTNTATQFSNNTVSDTSLNGDGQYLVTTENNQIYLYDNVARTAAQLLSVGTDGAIGNGASGGPIISADGNHIGFDSLASNLVLNDTNGVYDVFMLDRLSAPTVIVIAPTSGTTLGGTPVTITGTNFSGATAVTIGSTAATNLVVVNDSTITAVAPAHAAAGAVDVVVSTSAGNGTGPGLYTYVAPSVPTVTSISPNTGPASGGTPVTIIGSNFTGAAVVKFGSAPATTPITVNSTTSITATSPAGNLGVVDVTVMVAGVTSATGTSDRFTYVAATPPPALSLYTGMVVRQSPTTIKACTGTETTLLIQDVTPWASAPGGSPGGGDVDELIASKVNWCSITSCVQFGTCSSPATTPVDLNRFSTIMIAGAQTQS
jgi:IPT/TIG domain